MKLKSIHYQRNGVAGQSFFTCYYTDNSHPDFKGQMIATFATADGDESKIDRRSCRVINTDQPLMKYRGDEIADDLQKVFNKMSKAGLAPYGIYTFTENNKMILKSDQETGMIK